MNALALLAGLALGQSTTPNVPQQLWNPGTGYFVFDGGAGSVPFPATGIYAPSVFTGAMVGPSYGVISTDGGAYVTGGATVDNLTVTGTQTQLGNEYNAAGLAVDGGISWNYGASQPGCMAEYPGNYNAIWFGNNCSTAQANGTAYGFLGNQTQTIVNVPSAIGRVQLFSNNATQMLECDNSIPECISTLPFDADAGIIIGSGTTLTNAAVPTCALASGQCNAVVQGNQGSSNCSCDIQGGNWFIDAGAFVCRARADAGSATCGCFAGATALPGTPTVGFHCFN